MGILEAPQPGSDAWWRDTKQKINDLQRELDTLRAAVGKYGAVFNENGITIRDGGNLTIEDTGNFVIGQDASMRIRADNPDDQDVGYFGDLWWRGEKMGRGMYIATSDGRRVATISENQVDGSVRWVFYDGEGNELIGNDFETGFGLRNVVRHPVLEELPLEAPGPALSWPYSEWSTFYQIGVCDGVPLDQPWMDFEIEGGNAQDTDAMVQYHIRAWGQIIATSPVMTAGTQQAGTWQWTWNVAEDTNRFGNWRTDIAFFMRRVSGTDRAYARVKSVIARGTRWAGGHPE